MGEIKRLAALALLAAGMAHADDAVLAPEQLFERVSPSIWTVHTVDARNQPLAMGSAVVIAPGSLVTNCHVLRKAAAVTVGRDNVSYKAVLEYPDPERDLCLLRVRSLKAPAVTIGDAEALKPGSRVYAIGSPRGLEQTISDGLLSGLRKSEDGSFVALQITVPISPGSSGGGLFDARGHLVGITTFQFKEGQNLNFALPATWIADVPKRAQALMAAEGKRKESAGATATASAPAELAGRVFAYRLTDRITRNVQDVLYQVDRLDGERIVFNGGARVESPRGEVLTQTAALGGEADLAMPPGGWARPGMEVGAHWSLGYLTQVGRPLRMDLEASITREETLEVAGRQLTVQRIDFRGYTERNPAMPGFARGRYHATAWYSPELRRLVRFEVQSRGGTSGGQYVLDEALELVAIR